MEKELKLFNVFPSRKIKSIEGLLKRVQNMYGVSGSFKQTSFDVTHKQLLNDMKESGYIFFNDITLEDNKIVLQNLRLTFKGVLLLSELKNKKFINQIFIGIVIAIISTLILKLLNL